MNKSDLQKVYFSNKDIRKIIRRWFLSCYYYELIHINRSFVYKVYTLKGKYILRITGDKNNLDFNNKWVEFLAKNGIKTAKSVPSRKGNFTELITSKGVDFLINSSEFINAPHNFNYNSKQLEEIGEFIAQIHNLSEKFAILDKTKKTYFLNLNLFLNTEQEPFTKLNPSPQAKKVFDRFQSWINTLPKDPKHFGIIHGDIHLKNILWSKSQKTLIDFDLSGYCWYEMEIASMLNAIPHNKYNSVLKPLLEGYARVREIDTLFIKRIKCFFDLSRFIHEVTNKKYNNDQLYKRFIEVELI